MKDSNRSSVGGQPFNELPAGFFYESDLDAPVLRERCNDLAHVARDCATKGKSLSQHEMYYLAQGFTNLARQLRERQDG